MARMMICIVAIIVVFVVAYVESKTVIIGAGISGCAAAHILSSGGEEVIVLEAHDYTGGRMHSVEFEGNHIELGANWIHGSFLGNKDKKSKKIPSAYVDTNPLFRIKDAAGIDGTFTNFDDMNVYDSEGKLVVDMEDYWNHYTDVHENMVALAKELYKENNMEITVLDALKKFDYLLEKNNTTPEQRNIHRYASWNSVEYEYSSDPSELALAATFPETTYTSWDKTDFFIKNNFSRIPKFLCENVKVVHSVEVQRVDYSGKDKVIITAKDLGTNEITLHEADYVISTVSPYVIKKDIITWVPAMPRKQLQAYEKLLMPDYTKAFAIFSEDFWSNKTDNYDLFGHVSKNYGSLPAFVNLNLEKYFNNSNMLMIEFADVESQRIRNLSKQQLCAEIEGVLTKIFPDKDVSIQKFIMNDWVADEYVGGAWVSWPKGMSVNEFRSLKNPLRSNGVERVFFAGAGIDEEFFGFTHGGYKTGVDAAYTILNGGYKICEDAPKDQLRSQYARSMSNWRIVMAEYNNALHDNLC